MLCVDFDESGETLEINLKKLRRRSLSVFLFMLKGEFLFFLDLDFKTSIKIELRLFLKTDKSQLKRKDIF